MKDHVSLTQKYLPPECWEWLRRKTSYGSTIMECCRSAIDNSDNNVGLYAQDVECYDLFSEIFFPLISEYHQIDVNSLQSVHDLGDPTCLADLPTHLSSEILSTRIRVGRTVKGYPMAGKLTREQRIDLESKIKIGLGKLTGELQGTYIPLHTLSQEERDTLIEEHYLFGDADDKYLKSAGGYNDWPQGRGIYMNKTKTFLVWVNEEDHVRIISMQSGASMKQVWSRLLNAISSLESVLEFVKHEKLGYLTFCPTNIGTALRASVLVKVPKLAECGLLLNMCKRLNLQPRGMFGENTEPSEEGFYDISNKIRIGRTESELISSMWSGIKEMLENEIKCSYKS